MGGSVANPEAANAAVSAMRQQRSDETIERARGSDTQAWLEQRLDEQTNTVPVMGREFEFRPVGSERVAKTLDLIDGDANVDDISELPALLREVCSVLGETCTDPAMDAEAFGRLPADVNQRVFEDVAMPEGDLDPEQRERVDEFRGE